MGHLQGIFVGPRLSHGAIHSQLPFPHSLRYHNHGFKPLPRGYKPLPLSFTPHPFFIRHSSSFQPQASSPPPQTQPKADQGNHSYDQEEEQEGDSWEAQLARVGETLSAAFPLWVGLACIAALARPQAFSWIRGPWQVYGLVLTMLGMGITISLKDVKEALSMPKELMGGVALQYTVMPILGAVISKLLGLPPSYAAGLVLVACCPGGTASNVVTYLARGNVALSVLMTSASTFLAVVMTPLLTAKLAKQYVAIDGAALFASTFQVVLLPVLSGIFLAHYFPRLVRKISPFAPLVAIVTVAALCASAVGQNAAAILSSGGKVVLAVAILHSVGFLLGYLLSLLLGFDESSSRTISIEVGMQNSVLGVVLANQHFGNPLTAVPCAVSSVCHSVFGSMLAAYWRHTSASTSTSTSTNYKQTITEKLS